MYKTWQIIVCNLEGLSIPLHASTAKLLALRHMFMHMKGRRGVTAIRQCAHDTPAKQLYTVSQDNERHNTYTHHYGEIYENRGEMTVAPPASYKEHGQVRSIMKLKE
jgi:hypothetical protein